MNTDTPLPPDEPPRKNPPDGAMIDYISGQRRVGPVTLEIVDADGKSVRKYSSTDPESSRSIRRLAPFPPYWLRHAARAARQRPACTGSLWDLHYHAAARRRRAD